jgi:rod shape-determining protein MreC
VKNFVYGATQPLHKMTWGLGARISGGLQNIASIKNAIKENQDLRARIDGLLADNSRIAELKKENETLKEALGLGLDKEYDLRMAETIGMDMMADSLVVDKGAADMIETGFPVVTSNKVVIGRISKVYENFSKVDLITGKDITFDVNVSENATNGLAKGLGGFGLMLDLIPKDIEIRQGASVSTSALGGIFPEGFLVGMVDQVNKNDVETFQTATIKPAFEIGKVREIFIIIGYKFEDTPDGDVDKAIIDN